MTSLLDRFSLSTLVQLLVHIRGQKINLKDYVLFKPFYDIKCNRCMIIAGRQIGKSTALSSKQIVKCANTNYHRVLTVLPLQNQTQKFSKLYVEAMLRGSPVLAELISTSLDFRIALKKLTNEAEMHYSYVGDNPDRIRGISVAEVCWDELQDIYSDYIPIVEQCSSHELSPIFSYCGTPKTKNNTMEFMWQKSSQQEPFIKCSRCNFDNFCVLPKVYKMLQKKGLSCQNCGLVLSVEDVLNARYYSFNPNQVGNFEGYHIPQIFVRHNLHEKRWRKIMEDYEEYNEFLFATEVLGISFDIGGSPVTLEHLSKCCDEKRSFNTFFRRESYSHIIGGVDWGVSQVGSITVFTLVGLNHQTRKGEVLLVKKIKNPDPDEQVKEIASLFKQFSGTAIGVDYGMGFVQNIRLRTLLGPQCIYEYQYGMSNKNLTFLAEQGRYLVSRLHSLDLLFNDLRKQAIMFPKYEESRPFFTDIVSITEEMRMSPSGDKRFYVKTPSIPDDFTHALNFSLLTIRLLTTGSILSKIISE